MTAQEMIELIINMLWPAVTTIKIFALTALISLPFGVLVAILRKSKYNFISVPIRIYQLIARGTPLILQLMLIAYSPFYIFGATYDRFSATILAFSLNYTAYFGEIFRSGIDSIPKGQYEAAKVLGYTKQQIFIKIILPQVIKRILPTIGNEFMTLVKDTALAYTIGVAELYRLAQSISAREFSSAPLVIAGLFYLVMNSIVEYCFKKIERKLNYYN